MNLYLYATEIVPLKEISEAYIKRKVLPQVHDAWVVIIKARGGYGITLNRHFYRYDSTAHWRSSRWTLLPLKPKFSNYSRR